MKTRRGHSVVVLSNQNLFRAGLVELLRANGFDRVTQHTTTSELLAAARTETPDVLFVDLDHESDDTMTLIRLLRHELPQTQLVMIGTAQRQEAAGAKADEECLETPAATAAVLAAAAAFEPLPQSSERRRQQRRWSTVTPRQRDVLRWLARGYDNNTIAGKLRISERAVKAHLSALLESFGLKNRTQLALLADHAGLRPPRHASR